MEFFRVLANTLSRWKITLNRPSYSSSVLTRRAADFSNFFFPASERIAGSPLSQQAQQVASSPWSPSCRWVSSFLSLISTGGLLHFPLFPLVCPFSSTGDPVSPELLFLQSTHQLQIPAQNEHSKQDFEKCSQPLFQNSLPTQYHFSGSYYLFLSSKQCWWATEPQC